MQSIVGCSECTQLSSVSAVGFSAQLKAAAEAYVTQNYTHPAMRAPNKVSAALHLNGVPLLDYST